MEDSEERKGKEERKERKKEKKEKKERKNEESEAGDVFIHKKIPLYSYFVVCFHDSVKSGRTLKAFSVFNDMKKRGYKPSAYVYSSLFMGCRAGNPSDNERACKVGRTRGE